MMNEIIFTADDEDPVCHRCDNYDTPYEFCIENCGAEHWWGGYKRKITKIRSDKISLLSPENDAKNDKGMPYD